MLRKILGLSLVLTVIAMFSCEKDRVTPESPDQPVPSLSVTDTLSPGKLIISLIEGDTSTLYFDSTYCHQGTSLLQNVSYSISSNSHLMSMDFAWPEGDVVLPVGTNCPLQFLHILQISGTDTLFNQQWEASQIQGGMEITASEPLTDPLYEDTGINLNLISGQINATLTDASGQETEFISFFNEIIRYSL